MIATEALPTQVFQHERRPQRARMRPTLPSLEVVDQNPYKPSGGLWTSTWATAFEDGWPWWTREEEFLVRDRGWLLEPREARVITIDGVTAALEFEREFLIERTTPSWLDCFIDWPRVAEAADAVRLTAPYDPALRFGHEVLRSTLVWYGWDCESTWWARWCFEGKPQQVNLEREVSRASDH